MKKLLAALILLNTAPAVAAESTADITAQQQELEQNLDAASKEIIKGIQKTGQSMQMAIPVFAQHFKEIIRTFNQEMIPVMQAMEDNLQLLQADENMATSLKNALPEQYGNTGTSNINQQINELSVSGSVADNDTRLQYNISRNLAATAITESYVNKVRAVEEARKKGQPLPDTLGSKIINLNGKQLDTDNLSVEEINQIPYIVYNDKNKKECFLFGNLTPELNLRLQATGPEYLNSAKRFIKSLDRKKLQKAVSPAN